MQDIYIEYQLKHVSQVSQLHTEIDGQKTKFFANSPDYYFISEWGKQEGDHVKEGEEICTVEAYPEPFKFKAPVSGYLERMVHENEDLKAATGKPVFALYQEDRQRLANRYTSYIKADIDVKSDAITADWDYIAAPQKDLEEYYRPIIQANQIKKHLEVGQQGKQVRLKVVNLDGKDFLLVDFKLNGYEYNPEDRLSLMLDSGESLVFKEGRPYKLGGFSGFRFKLYFEYVEAMSQSPVTKIRISISEADKYITVPVEDSAGQWYPSVKDFNFAFRNMMETYLKYLNQISSIYKPIYKANERKKERKERPSRSKAKRDHSFVFLVKDSKTGYCRLGISKNPEEELAEWLMEYQTAKIIAKKGYPNNKLATAVGNGLYHAFQYNQVEDEWLELNKEDLEDLLEILR